MYVTWMGAVDWCGSRECVSTRGGRDNVDAIANRNAIENRDDFTDWFANCWWVPDPVIVLGITELDCDELSWVRLALASLMAQSRKT